MAEEIAGNGRVVISDGVVRRPASAATPTIHHFLRHLHSTGEITVPEPLGIDGATELLRHLPGRSGRDGWFAQHAMAGVQSAARLLRRLHDASTTWTPPSDAFFTVESAFDGDDVVYGHGDPGPWNFVWNGHEAVGLIDWDFLHPCPRVDDVAYALLWFAPLRDDDLARQWHHFAQPPDRRARVAAFLDAYGPLPAFDVVEAVVRRRQATIEQERRLAEAGVEPQRTWVAQGHLDDQRREVEWLLDHRHLVLS